MSTARKIDARPRSRLAEPVHLYYYREFDVEPATDNLVFPDLEGISESAVIRGWCGWLGIALAVLGLVGLVVPQALTAPTLHLNFPEALLRLVPAGALIISAFGGTLRGTAIWGAVSGGFLVALGAAGFMFGALGHFTWDVAGFTLAIGDHLVHLVAGALLLRAALRFPRHD